MDQKIQEKRKLQEEEETKQKVGKDLEKKKDYTKKQTELKKSEKGKPSLNKEKEIAEKQVLEDKLKHPKLRRLPDAVNCLNPNSIEYIAEGNGACCVNCVAMWLFLNETEMGPQTGRDLNTFIATYRGHFEPLLEFPMDIVIGVGGKTIRFEKGEEDSFFDTLVSSQEMSFMWRNGFDIQALTDMTNLSIEVTVFNALTNSVENVQTFQPTPNFPWNEFDSMKPAAQQYKRGSVKLINYKNQHFNLIVDENDEIVKMLVPERITNQHMDQRETEKKENSSITEIAERLKIAEKSNKELKEKLKVSDQSKTKLQIDHKEAIKEIGRMKEVIEKYKIENKTLSEYKSMIVKDKPNNAAPSVAAELPPGPVTEVPLKFPRPEAEVGKGPVQQPTDLPAGVSSPESSSQVESEPTSSSPAPWTLVPSSNRKKPIRTGSGSESNQRNCPKCYFQSNCKDEMENHFKKSHVPKDDTSKVAIRTERITCRNCKVEFSNYWSLMNHRRDNHPTDKACRYDLEDKCKHSSEECWYKHKNGRNPLNKTQSSNMNNCFECKMNFRNRHELMMHKKVEHVEQCKPCDNYLKNECTREDSCWYPHTQNLDFHKNLLNTRPPINPAE